MKITDAKVRYVADLANLKLNDEEIQRLAHDLDEILTYMDQLNALDTSQVEPMAQVVYDREAAAAWRDDVERPPIGNELAIANAAVSGAGYFKVPRVIER